MTRFFDLLETIDFDSAGEDPGPSSYGCEYGVLIGEGPKRSLRPGKHNPKALDEALHRTAEMLENGLRPKQP